MAAIQRSAFYSKRGEIGSEEKIKTMIALCTRTQGKLFLQKCEHSSSLQSKHHNHVSNELSPKLKHQAMILFYQTVLKFPLNNAPNFQNIYTFVCHLSMRHNFGKTYY